MTINDRLRFFRKEIIKATQNNLAKELNISRSNLASLESGRNSVTNRVISDLCRLYGVNEQWLKNGEEPVFDENKKDSIIGNIVEIYNNLSPEFQNYLIGYAHRLLEEQSKKNS